MTRQLAFAAMLFSIVISTWCGCSKPPAPLPSQLVQQIASADQVVLTNGPDSSFTFSGVEAQKIIRAVSEAEPKKMYKDETSLCPGGFYLQFWRGTNLLIQMSGHDDHFHAPNGIFYSDRSRVLQTAWESVHTKPPLQK